LIAIALALASGFGMAGSKLRAYEPPRWSVNTWPGGIVYYRYATEDDDDWRNNDANPVDDLGLRGLIELQMRTWEGALRRVDPADANRSVRYIQFVPCGTTCKGSYVLIRMNSSSEDNNMCTYLADTDGDGEREEHVGRNPDGPTHLHLKPDQDANTIRHELGHCLGLWHEQNRGDRDAYLKEKPEADSTDDWETLFDDPVPERPVWLMPRLGNYDYDSIMHYKSKSAGRLRWEDARDNEFDRTNLDTAPPGVPPPLVSPRDVSRVMQYYARDAQPNWGFFESLAQFTSDPDALPDPNPAPNVTAVGTPAVAWQSDGNYDIFTRSSAGHIYGRAFRRVVVGAQVVFERGPWTRLTTDQDCCFVTDPAAVSPAPGEVQLVAIHQDGWPMKKRLLNDVWGSWTRIGAVRPDIPLTGLRIGPAVASRGGLLDVFVVLSSGDLAVSTRTAGGWTAWTVFDRNIIVTARPAAIAVSATEVRLAVNADDVKLYEPLVTFDYSSQNPTATFGTQRATTAARSAPAIAARAGSPSYRVLIVDGAGVVAHKFQSGGWWHVGGIPRVGTGVSAVGDGATGAIIVMRGEDMRACRLTCVSGGSPNPNGFVHNGAIWTRRFY
jgi:hypothetical protein